MDTPLGRYKEREVRPMQVVYQRCCGLDVHKKIIVACLMVMGVDGRLSKEIRSFGTMTQDILALSDWLLAAGCRGQPGGEDPGRSQYQAGLGGIGCYGDFGEGYPCGSHSRLDGCSGHGGAGPGEAAPEAARAQAGPGGTDGGSPALYADRATGAYRRPG